MSCVKDEDEDEIEYRLMIGGGCKDSSASVFTSVVVEVVVVVVVGVVAEQVLVPSVTCDDSDNGERRFVSLIDSVGDGMLTAAGLFLGGLALDFSFFFRQ